MAGVFFWLLKKFYVAGGVYHCLDLSLGYEVVVAMPLVAA
jgi:hypothetical protein